MGKRGRAPKFTVEEVNEAMRRHDGDRLKAAEDLGVSHAALSGRLKRDSSLRSLWVRASPGGKLPDDADLMVRKEPPVLDDGKMVKSIEENGKEVFINEVETMLRDPDKNLDKLKVFDGFDDSLGLFFSECLKVTHKMAVRQNMSLFEMMEDLKDELAGGKLDLEDKILMTRLFLQMSEQQGKFFDRTLHSIDMMVKMTERETGSGKKKKPGFAPLRELKEIEEEKGIE
jgi:hypothetical protein